MPRERKHSWPNVLLLDIDDDTGLKFLDTE